ncbi:O-methyltransferase [Trichosporon asahii var. asahii CBS 2479]|uniref:O-methyltransferase n=1 Tax=Trichosporon asahii var. asahii (strain ATCC 90039 / CBS 2479 / JCM 2466 / KCTC 7840 / NBRC 103889/ NCYC 2677 / UAMH 7654) TaxID=1186058 RepID=J5R313_TRIAS|nr:O-methyltransferase [Trichosporon asahii var. asahii CBS 2479]EJT50443.1 O-methyltransferase [Trichosporon asahii var. asahii CBS 2479]
MISRTTQRTALRSLRELRPAAILGAAASTRLMSVKMSRPLDSDEAGNQYWKTSLGTQIYLDTRLGNAEYALPKLPPNEPPPPNQMFGQFLAILIKTAKVETVLEIGTGPGCLSTTFLATPLPAQGRIDVLETSTTKAAKAEKAYLDLNFFPFPKVHTSASSLSPPGTQEGYDPEERGYDLAFVHDTSVTLENFKTALNATKKGGIIVLNGTVREGRVAIPPESQDENDDYIAVEARKINEWIKADTGKTVLGSCLQTVDRVWDGFTVVYKR